MITWLTVGHFLSGFVLAAILYRFWGAIRKDTYVLAFCVLYGYLSVFLAVFMVTAKLLGNLLSWLFHNITFLNPTDHNKG